MCTEMISIEIIESSVCYDFYYNSVRPVKAANPLNQFVSVPALLLVKKQNQNHKTRTTITDTVSIPQFIIFNKTVLELSHERDSM